MKKIIFIFLISLIAAVTSMAQPHNKRDFRGVWIHTLNNDYKGMNATQFKEYLTQQLDLLQQAGINALFFQVRPEADALYQSEIEPWSRFLTGNQGENPGYDPMAIAIAECHRRFMEFHAWINPYRAQLNKNTKLHPTHPYNLHPEWFFSYNNQLWFNPGLAECRQHINKVVADIVYRYDVDGVHVDDYFYPYPAGGQQIPDDKTYETYGKPRGLGLEDWRRYNVNILVQELQETVHKIKPFVKFGISPFGIYRNRKSAPDGFGSETNGLQNYDDLYADVLLWLRYGWVDYIVPQIYWEIGHSLADYNTLTRWWASCSYGRLLFIGQDVDRSAKAADPDNANTNQFRAKLNLSRSLEGISGNSYWSGKVLLENPGNIYTLLEREYNRLPALPPVYPEIATVLDKYGNISTKNSKPVSKLKAPAVSGLKVIWTEEGPVLMWKEPKRKTLADDTRFYIIYRFGAKEKIDLSDPTRIVARTRSVFYPLPYSGGTTKYQYVVTAINRYNQESKPTKKLITL